METLEWSHPIQLNTKRGVRLLKKAPLTRRYWEVYRENPEGFKEAFRQAGISMTKFREEWELAWWSDEKLKFPALAEFKEETQESDLDISTLPQLHYPDGLLEYQVTSVQLGVRSMQRYNRVLLGHATGVGKTFCALGIARELNKDIAVICPKAIKYEWGKAAKMMGVDIYEICGWEWTKTGKTKIGRWADEKKDNFRYILPDNIVLIFDEVHRGKGQGTQNAILIRDSVTQNIPSIALSATIADDPTKLWALGQFLGLHKGGSDFPRFLSRNGCYKKKFRGSLHALKKIHTLIYPNRGNRLRHSDLGDAFPETLVRAKAFNMDGAERIAKEYKDLAERLDNLKLEQRNQANLLAAITKARQKIELLKAPAVASLAEDLIEEGNSVFLAVNYTATRLWLMDKLATDCVIHGGQTETERMEKINYFQSNQSKIIIGIIQACREGLNLHDVDGSCPRVSLIMPTPSVFDLKQVLGRVHRVGGKSKSIQYIIYAASVKIEENICEKLDEKIKRLDTLNDGECDPTVVLYPQQ